MKRGKRISLGRGLHPWEKAIASEGDLYLVGGVVRDLLLGGSADPPDIDYVVCGIEYDRLEELLEPFGATNLVGKSFGVIKFNTPEGSTVDISMPRTELSTGHGHREFDVRHDPGLPIERDLERRDFTINSMAYHLGEMRIIDPLGGRNDLGKKVLRVNRDTSFAEDPLRILRAVQFMARFNLTVDGATRALMEGQRELVGTVSPERIRDEMSKLMLSQKPSSGFILMHETGILKEVLPELDETWGEEQNEFHPDDVFIHSVKSCDEAKPDLAVRWAALLHDICKPMMRQAVNGRIVFYRHEEAGEKVAGEIMNRLRYPKDLSSRVTSLIRYHMFNITEEWSDGALRRFIAKVGSDNLEDLFALRSADARSRGDLEIERNISWLRKKTGRILAEESALKRADLAITGRDVMELLDIEEGEEVGIVLDMLLDRVLDDPRLNTRERLLELVREWRPR
jgi:tRNA nucleotidyltransferase (CCA-adding enzyme)